MRDDWTETTLGEVLSIQSGFAFSTNDWADDGYPVIKINNVRDGRVSTESCSYISDPIPKGSEKFRLSFGDLLITLTGEIGATGTVHQDFPMYLNQRVGKITVLDGSRVLLNYLAVHFNYQPVRDEMWSLGKGNAQLNISPKSIHEMQVNLPPIAEQRRIVDVVSSVDAYIDALQQQVDAARTARNAVLHELLESLSKFPVKKLRDLTTKIGSGATPRGGESVYLTSGISLIRSQNVHNSLFLHEGLVAIDDFAAKALNGVSVEPNDVLINITGASVARTCLVDETVLPARVNQHVAIIRTKKVELVPGFLLQILLGQTMNSYLLDISGSGTTRQAITKAQLEDLEIVVPPIAEQERIVEIVSSMDEVIQAAERAVVEAKNLRSGLLSDLLSGEHEIPVSYDELLGAA